MISELTPAGSVYAPVAPASRSSKPLTGSDSLWISCGILFIILFFTAGSLVPSPPSQHKPDQEFFNYYGQYYDGHILAVSIAIIALLSLLIYISGLYQALLRSKKVSPALAMALYSNGLVATLLLIIAQVSVAVVARVAHYKGSGAVIRGLDELGHVSAHLFSYPMGIVLLLMAFAFHKTGFTAKWQSWAAGLIGAGLLATAGTFEIEHVLHNVGGIFLLLFMLFMVVSSSNMLWRIRKGID